jgi:hypothetical protein
MNINDLTYEDRVNLIIIFCLFRANDTEDDYRGYAHRDMIQQKLYDGGELDEHERHLLFVAVCNDVEADARMRDHFCSILRQEQRGTMVEGEKP